jgi:flagellar basal-body rod protein FlgB
LVNRRSFAGFDDNSGMSPLDAQSGLLARLMDATALRQRVVSRNIANLHTPGFHRLEVDFEERLAKAMSAPPAAGKANPADVQTKVQETKGLASRVDGNNVDMDREIGELQRTAMLFQTYTQLLQTRMGMMRRAMESR